MYHLGLRRLEGAQCISVIVVNMILAWIQSDLPQQSHTDFVNFVSKSTIY